MLNWKLFIVAVGLIVLPAMATDASSARIIKVLPHFLDTHGRTALAPSLYERDAYQDYLLKNPGKQSGLRFDVHWKAKSVQRPLLRIEIRTREHFAKPLVVEQPVKQNRFFSTWSSLTLEGDQFLKLGEIIAWRASLWQDDQLIAEQKSFLW